MKKNVEHSHKMKEGKKSIFKNKICYENLRNKSSSLDLWH